MRLFVAVGVSGDISRQLSEWQQQLARIPAQVRWAPSEQYHLTVKFIGEIAEAHLAELCRRLDKAAAETPAFDLSIAGLARLQTRGQVRIIMAQVVSPDQRLGRLHRRINQEFAGLGIPLDTRPLRPHLSLGRVQSNHSLNKLLRRLEHYAAGRIAPLGPWPVGEVSLMQSTLSPQGAVYRGLHRATLQPAAAQ